MARVVIAEALFKQLHRHFNKTEANKIIDLLETLEQQPHKGKALFHHGKFVVKELKYKKFRFYFVTDGQILKFGTQEELVALLIKFIKMSDKKDQQQVIDDLKQAFQSMDAL